MPNIDDEIRARIESFAGSLTTLVRQAALEAVQSAMGGAAVGAPAPAVAKRGRGRPKMVAAPAAKAPVKVAVAAKPAQAAPAAKGPLSKKAAAPKRAPGEKRDPKELAKLVDRLAEYIKANPGKRMEAIGKALGTPTKDLTLPVRKLLSAKKLRTQGEKRATEYYPM